MLSLRWAVDSCNAQYIMKTDDDMIINYDVMVDQFVKLPSNITKGRDFISYLPFASRNS